MEQVTRKVSLDYDFEDLLESFEKKFAKKLAEREPPKDFGVQENTTTTTKATLSSTKFDPSEYADELSLLLSEIQRNVLYNTPKAADGQISTDTRKERRMDFTISREVMRAEIRTTIEQVRHLQESTRTDSKNISPSQRSTLMSMKRRVREMSDEIEILRKQKKTDDLKRRNMEDTQAADMNKIKMLQGKLALLETEQDEHDAKIREYETSTANLTTDKRRLEKNVAMLRSELLKSHHKVSDQKLKTSQAERRVADLETRAAELRSSESTLTERVKELHEVQGKMLQEMKKVVESRDAPAARRALANLSTQRSRIVGRIAAIMSKRSNGSAGEDENEMQDMHVDQDTSAEAKSNYSDILQDDSSQRHQVPGAVEDASSPVSLSEGRQESGDAVFGRKSSLLQIFRAGQGQQSSPRSNDRPSFVQSAVSKSERQQIYESNLLRSREVAERDSDVLREVVEKKASEIERLEEELKVAKDAAAIFERDLHNERQNRRKENRNLHVSSEDEARKHIGQVIKERNKQQSLFEWHGSRIDSGNGGDEFFPESARP